MQSFFPPKWCYITVYGFNIESVYKLGLQVQNINKPGNSGVLLKMKKNIITLSFFKYTTFSHKFWAMQMMQFAHANLKKAGGIKSYKLLGTGSGKGFNAWPDFSTYALLIFWENEALADAFINGSKLFREYRQHAYESYTVFHVPLGSHGAWDGKNPFKPDLQSLENNDLICVITRASLNARALHQFWKYVPKINDIIADQEGLLFYKGIGEWPVMEMATYSIWKNMDSMKAFAYKTDNHRGAISNSRRKNWFKEDLFARLQPYKAIGSWQNENPLHGYLK